MIGIPYIENEYILLLINIKQSKLGTLWFFSLLFFFSREIPLTLKHQSVENIHQYISHSWRLQIKNKIYRIETLYMYTLNTYLYNNVHTLILYMKVIIHIFHSTSFGPCENALGYAGQVKQILSANYAKSLFLWNILYFPHTIPSVLSWQSTQTPPPEWAPEQKHLRNIYMKIVLYYFFCVD